VKCPHCNAVGKAPVMESRQHPEGVLRRRSCALCFKAYVTLEFADRDLRIHRDRSDRPRAAEKAEELRTTSPALFRVWK
jgi:transcriptional regulator NrdR family protein